MKRICCFCESWESGGIESFLASVYTHADLSELEIDIVTSKLLDSVFTARLEKLGIPPETAPLMLIRPVSGSGALAVASELMAAHGPDSTVGRVAAVMMGSTETTFYTIAVYFGSAGIVRTRHTVPAALAADFTGFLAAAWTVRLFFGP